MEKIVVYFVIMLFLLTIFSTSVYAGDEKDPEFIDKRFDVRGFMPGISQRRIDMLSSWFFEDESNPNKLYVSLKLMNLNAKYRSLPMLNFIKILLKPLTSTFQGLYAVAFSIDNYQYSTLLHEYPDFEVNFFMGKSTRSGYEIDTWDYCDGIFDIETNIITWEIPKEYIRNPQPMTQITNIGPHTHLRFYRDPGGETMDLAKYISINAKLVKDYTIKY
jgi:hypothetical protein